MRRNVRANSPWCGSRRGAVCWRGVPPRRPAHLFVGLGCEAGALDAQRDDVLLAQLHLRRVQASRSGRALALRQGKAGEGRARQGEGGKAAEGAARRRLGERVDHVFLDAILDALHGHDHACRNQTGWLAPVATQSNAAWRARQWAKMRRRETGRNIASFVLAATPEGRSTAAGCTLESGRLLSGHMYLCGAGAKCKRSTLLAAAAHGCSRES